MKRSPLADSNRGPPPYHAAGTKIRKRRGSSKNGVVARARVAVPSVFPRRWASAAEREPADPDALRLEDGDGARFEFVCDCVEVREQKRRLLLGPPFGASTEQDDGRTSALRVARSVAKSVSADTRIRSSAAARSKISSSAAA